MHCFLVSCDHTILFKVEGGPASLDCRCDHIDRLNIKAVVVMRPVGNVLQLAYLRTNK